MRLIKVILETAYTLCIVSIQKGGRLNTESDTSLLKYFR